MSRDISELMDDLDGGTLSEKVSRALAATAIRAVDTAKGGEVLLSLKLKPIRNSSQVEVVHKIKTDYPTMNGNVVESDENSTIMYVGPKGVMTINPPDQMKMFGEKE
ncbi:hypothetical protein [Zhongshania sp.]|uniref:hypothetical protein n=1 Tax=Zhongshania sp. TaxID=1971902 RepID=UPI0035672A45